MSSLETRKSTRREREIKSQFTQHAIEARETATYSLSSFSSTFSSFFSSAASPPAAAAPPAAAGAAPPAPTLLNRRKTAAGISSATLPNVLCTKRQRGMETYVRRSLMSLPSRALARRVAQIGSASTLAALVRVVSLSAYIQ